MSADHPSENLLLRDLPDDEWQAIASHLVPMTLDRGAVLCEAGADVQAIYFPTDGVISSVTTMRDGNSVECFLSGRDGVASQAAAQGVPESPWRVMVQVSGQGLSIIPGVLAEALVQMPELRRRFALYSHVMLQLAGQSVGCNRFHLANARLARWLLTVHDHVDGDEVDLTHEFMAQLIGAWRPTVSLAFGELAEAGFVARTGRGHIRIVDRAGLLEASCECYFRVALQQNKLLGTIPRT